MPFSLILDIVIAVLLVATIAYAFLLNRRLAGLRRDKRELESLAATFGQATIRAEESIAKLKFTVSTLNDRVDRAEALRDDLAFLVDRGSRAADQLEEAIRRARKAGAVPSPGSGTASDPVAVAEAARRVKSQLAKGALGPDRGNGVETGDDDRFGETGSGGAKPGPETDAMEGREPIPPPTTSAGAWDDDGIAPKSEAERELLKALRAAR